MEAFECALKCSTFKCAFKCIYTICNGLSSPGACRITATLRQSNYNVMLSAGIAVVVLVNDWRNVEDWTGISRWPAMPPPRIRLIRSKMEPRLVNKKKPQK